MTAHAYLDKAAPIVNPVDGRITPYFQRFWQNLNISVAVTARALQTLDAKAVKKGADPVPWTLPGAVLNHNFTLFVAPPISNPPTQAEVQAIADALEALNRNVLTLILAARAAGLVA